MKYGVCAFSLVLRCRPVRIISTKKHETQVKKGGDRTQGLSGSKSMYFNSRNFTITGHISKE